MKRYSLISISILLAACDVTELRDPTIVVESKEVINLVVVDADYKELTAEQTLLADSTTVCFLKAVLQPKSDDAQEIVFATTGGVLTNVGTAPTDESQSTLTVTPADREIIIQLNTLDIINKNVVVSATTGKVSDVVELTFEPAYPYTFQVSPSSTSVLKTEEVEISIQALVDEGVMSEGQYIKISATTDDDIALDYPEFVKVSNQKAKFKIINKSETAGEVVVDIEVATGADESLTKQVTITYN